MPNMIQRAWSAVNKPMTNAPSKVAKKLSDKITSPNVNEGKLSSQLRGFVGGAVEGIGNVLDEGTSALGLGSMAFPMLRGMKPASGIIKSAVAPTMDVIQEAPAVKQVVPAMDDVNALIGDLQRSLAKVPSKGQKVTPSVDVASLPPEMVPPGMEHIFNNARAVDKAAEAAKIKDVAKTGSFVTGKVRMPTEVDKMDVVQMMRDLDIARGKTKAPGIISGAYKK